MKEQAKQWILSHVGLLSGIGIGLLIGILLLSIGLFATLLLALCVGIGALVGGVPVIRTLLSGWMEKLLDKTIHKF